MNTRKYPIAQAHLKRRERPWDELSLKVKELGSTQHAVLELSRGLLAGVEIEIGTSEITIKHASAVQERLLAQRADALARRLGRSVRFV